MTFVFQYGSNCLDSQINSRDRLCGDAIFVGIAETVDDFKLSFDVWSNGRSCAAANIVSSPGNKVWGALYEIPDHLIDRDSAKAYNRKSLDAIEGKKYRREQIRLKLSSARQLTAVTYRVADPEPNHKTSAEYVEFIVKGLRERGIHAGYIAEVKDIASSNNPAIAAAVKNIWQAQSC